MCIRDRPSPAPSPLGLRFGEAGEATGRGLGEFPALPRPSPCPRPPGRRPRGSADRRPRLMSLSDRPVPSPSSPKRGGSREGAGEGLGELSEPSVGPFALLSEAETERGRSRGGPRRLGEFSEPSAGRFARPSEAETEQGRDRPRARRVRRGPRLPLPCSVSASISGAKGTGRGLGRSTESLRLLSGASSGACASRGPSR